MPPFWSEGKYDEESPALSFRKPIGSLFEDFDHGFLTKGECFVVRSNVRDTDQDLTVTAELRGVEEKDADVSVTGNRITIEGEKQSGPEEKNDEKGRKIHILKECLVRSNEP